MIVFMGKDKADSAHIRQRNRQAHVERLKKFHEEGLIAFGGPLKDDSNENMIGSLILFHTDSLDMVKEIMEDDPYTREGLFESTQIHRVDKVLTSPL
ncbi:YciI family protein [Desulfurispirillum indicum]|uniref:YCII-related protein n=1 Tax=Desulfurispirillum indicum (strain ATCC BAA-1389 / DSM 22839 / S5) TaxID=653733 RepID=E6W2X7_DESIS|nr:YciI family protein [Desulfurispirillum indicum]ADU66802.1 YCII-related protein [Desulfurispirillum indicum S5]UCZ56122.1 YciI family protein [Desulfurispirillum indicum]